MGVVKHRRNGRERIHPYWFFGSVGTGDVKGTVWLLREHGADYGREEAREVCIRDVDSDNAVGFKVSYNVVETCIRPKTFRPTDGE